MSRRSAFESAVDAWNRRAGASWNRMARTPIGRLRWVIDFVNREDLNELQAGEWLDLEADLYALVVASGYQPSAHSGDPRPPDLSHDTIADLHREIRRGIHHDLLRGAGWVIAFPRVGTNQLGKLKRQVIRRRKTGLVRTVYEGNVSSLVPMAVADLLTAEGHRLRGCQECRRVFVRVKRQEFCDSRCSQRVRTRRFRRRRAKSPTPADR
jgi:hypothetical protein